MSHNYLIKRCIEIVGKMPNSYSVYDYSIKRDIRYCSGRVKQQMGKIPNGKSGVGVKCRTVILQLVILSHGYLI